MKIQCYECGAKYESENKDKCEFCKGYVTLSKYNNKVE